MTKNNGGFAFPRPEGEHEYGQSGMTLRDYFAAQAIQNVQWNPLDTRLSAKRCYEIADAMLAERDRKD